MSDREPFAPEDRDPDAELYNAAPASMPPSPAGANTDLGGEPAASRRIAGLPADLAGDELHRVGMPTPGAEPVLGYDGLPLDDLLDWIRDADPEAEQLRSIVDYEASHRHRDAVLRECRDRLRRIEGSSER